MLFSDKDLRNLLWPLVIEQVLVMLVGMVSHFETVQLAANGVANSIGQIAVMVVNAVNLAVITVVGQCVGAGCMLVFRLGSAMLFGVVLGWGVIGVWAAMGMDWLARSACFTLRCRKKSWRNCRAIA